MADRTRTIAIVIAAGIGVAAGGYALVSRAHPSAVADAADAADASQTASDVSFLHVNSVPPATVTLDGKPIGKTPIERVEVTPGVHKLVFVNVADDKSHRTISVHVAPGATKAVVVRLGD